MKCESLSILVTACNKNRKGHTINQVIWYAVKRWNWWKMQIFALYSQDSNVCRYSSEAFMLRTLLSKAFLEGLLWAFFINHWRSPHGSFQKGEESLVLRDLQKQMTRAPPARRRGHVEWKYEPLTLDPFASLFWFLEQYTVGRHKQWPVLQAFVRLGKNSGQLAVTPT